MSIREEVDTLRSQITASKLETLRLERKLRVIQAVCPHEDTSAMTEQGLYLNNNCKVTVVTCNDCGKAVVIERTETIKR